MSPIDFEFEELNLTLEQLKGHSKKFLLSLKFISKDMIYEEILLYHFEDFRKEYETKKAKGLSITKHIIENENSKYIVRIFQFKLFNLVLLPG